MLKEILEILWCLPTTHSTVTYNLDQDEGLLLFYDLLNVVLKQNKLDEKSPSVQRIFNIISYIQIRNMSQVRKGLKFFPT